MQTFGGQCSKFTFNSISKENELDSMWNLAKYNDL